MAPNISSRSSKQRFYYDTPTPLPPRRSTRPRKSLGKQPALSPPEDTQFSRHDPTPTQIDQCQKALNEAAAHGDILTWSSETNSDRPTVWNSLPSAEWPLPQCPHAMNPFRLESETRQQAFNTKQEGWHFKAPGHACIFINKISPLGSRKLTEHGEDSDDENQGHWADSADEEESFTLMALDVEAAAKVAEVNTETEKRLGSLSWPPPPLYSPGGPPAYSSPVPSTSSPIRPRPSPANSNQIKSYMSCSKADDRAAYNKDFALRIQDNQWAAHPEEHPAWKRALEDLPVLMRPFHPVNQSHLPTTFMTTLCGEMLTELNSTMGLPKETFLRILVQNIQCDVCLCAYSVEGYHDHRKAHEHRLVCSNTPDLYPIEEKHLELEGLYDMVTRTHPSGIPLSSHSSQLNSSAIGRAWIAWNSHIGIPMDVWAVISSAWTYCGECQLVHAFESDRVHRDENNLCRDVGQGKVGTIVRGQERADPNSQLVVWKMS
ncbi:hypothetical protein B0H17DRAFT_1251655 [Mycena rosella]|uniref:Uncharacterized protein n=1 Tax=Mycena rosella TaxID=1033263 RepID=A0AAD7CX16_MYCRO|nr:hypothetical protein B0H17DRAFT_1251655 [Mycena rosella]